MRKILVSLLMLALLCVGAAAPAAGEEALTLEVNTAKLPLYEADDPHLAELGMAAQPEGDALPVLVLAVKKSLQIQAAVSPRSVKNRKYTVSVDNEEVAKVRGTTVSALKPGETVLTVASQQDPAVTVRYRILAIQPVTRITVTASGKSVAAGRTIVLTPAFIPEDATLKAVVWSSANEQIATVDENGTVTGMKRGNARITAVAKDGGGIRANINVQVTQSAEEIILDKTEITVDTGKTGMLKATVLPKDTNDKGVVWSSSDESVAKVNAQGRVTGVALGDCEIICASRETEGVQAKAVVHVQQPVTKVAFGDAPAVYAGESAQLAWTIEPENASNKAVVFKSGNEKILTVSGDGVVTGVSAGETYVNVVTQDGSKRQARVKIKVYQHVTGVHMLRKTAYVDLNTTSTTRAVLEPENAANRNMTWESADPGIATAAAVAKQKFRVDIHGVSEGETTVTGTTEDGGYQASIQVKVGHFSNAMKIVKAEIGGKGQLYIKVKNVSEDLPVSSVKLEMEAYDEHGSPVSINTKNGSNIVQLTYGKWLYPGEATPEDHWKAWDYDKDIGFQAMIIRIVEFQIDNDWVKQLSPGRQPKYEYNPFK